jgi:plasmid stabilization system protein ParE
VKIEWLFEAQSEYRNLLTYYKTTVGIKYAQSFSNKILTAVAQLEEFPLLGVLRCDTLMGKHGFRALFIDQYVCIYKIENDCIYIYHLTDARKNYIYHIFGME